MSCVEKTNGRFTSMHKLGVRQHKSVAGHKGFVPPRKVIVSHDGNASVGVTSGPTLAQTSAMGATSVQVKTGG